MKRFLQLSAALLLAASANVNAQDIVIDFEGEDLPGEVATAWCDGSLIQVANPSKSGINTSDKVVEVNNIWSESCALHTWSVEVLPDGKTFSDFKEVSFQFYSPTANNWITAQEGTDWVKFWEGKEVVVEAETWTEVILPIASLASATKFFIGLSPQAQNTYYIDNIKILETSSAAIDEVVPVGKVSVVSSASSVAVALPAGNAATVKVFNMMGVAVATQCVDGAATFDGLAAGLYFVQVEDLGFVQKVMVK